MALLGIGTFTQVKSISDALTMSFSIPRYITAILLTIAVAFITIEESKELLRWQKKLFHLCAFYTLEGLF